MRFAVNVILPIAALLVLGSCFTGIESTPKITAKELQEQKVAETDESRFAASLSPAPLKEWLKGRRFLVADPKLSMIFEREPSLQAGDILQFEGYESRPTISGDTLSWLLFAANDGSRLRYPVNIAPSQIAAGASISLPMAVDLELVENVERQIKGKSYYLLTPLRVDASMTRLPTA